MCFLDGHGCRYHREGSRWLAYKAPVPFALLMAGRWPEGKKALASLVVNLINGKN